MAAVSSRLSPFPARVGGGGGAALLAEATLWLDAYHSKASEPRVVNQGSGGSALNATYGSTASADTNDPLWLGHDGVNYAYLPGISGNYLSIPNHADFNTARTIYDVRFAMAMDDWTPSAVNILMNVRGTATTNIGWSMSIQTNGRPNLVWSTDGSATTGYTATVAPTVSDGGWLAMKVTVDSTAGGNNLSFYTKATTPATAKADCQANSGWTLLESIAGPSAPHFASTAALAFGALANGTFMSAGKVAYADLRTSIDGAIVRSFDPSLALSSDTSWTAVDGAEVTVNRSTSGRKTCLVTRPVWLFGTDDYMEIADNALLDFGASDSFTVVWVGRQWNTPPSGGRMVSKANSGTITGYHVAANSTTLTPLISVGDGVTNRGLNPTAVVQGALSVVGGVVDRTAETLTAFTNNTFSATGSTAGIGSLANAYPLRVGSRGDAAGTYADMELVAVAVFRRALTAAEIALICSHYGTV